MTIGSVTVLVTALEGRTNFTVLVSLIGFITLSYNNMEMDMHGEREQCIHFLTYIPLYHVRYI